MSWRRRLRDLAVAGGLAGCTAQAVGGGTGSTSGGTGGGYTGTMCNANPDPCCPCSYLDGQGGYGGAACLSPPRYYFNDAGLSCADELACLAAQTAVCCADFHLIAPPALAAACADAGYSTSSSSSGSGGPGPGDAGSD
jgi:hypothetical protein